MIKAEGLAVRLRFARDEQERVALEHEREENAKRSEVRWEVGGLADGRTD